MLYSWMLVAAVMAQTSQPAGHPGATPVRLGTSAVGGWKPPAPQPVSTTRPAWQSPSTQPAWSKTAPTSQPSAASIGSIGQLSGDPVETEITPDGIILYGNTKDLEILSAFIEMMETQQGPERVFEIFTLNSAQANTLAPDIERMWTAAKTGPAGIRPDDKVTIVPEPRANVLMVAASKENMPEIADIIHKLDQAIVKAPFTPFQLKHIKASEAEAILKDMLESIRKQRGANTELFNIKAVVPTNTLLVSAPETELDQIRKLIDLIDVEPTPEMGGVVKLALYPLTKAVAKDLADVLTNMLQAQGDQAKAMKEQIRRLQVIKKAAGTADQTVDVNLDKPIKVLPEPGSNALIVATVEANLGPIGDIIKMLDTPPLCEEMMVKIFPLEHADAESLQAALKDIFDQGSRLPEEPGRAAIQGRIPSGLAGTALAYKVGLSIDKRTNTVIVSGRAEALLLAEKIVSAVDVEENANRFPPRLVKLEHSDVRRIAEGLQKLADQRQQMWDKMGPNAAMRERVLLIPDVRSNNLIVVAKDDNFKEFAKLATDLDGAEDKFLGQIRIINMEKLTATDIASKIEDLWKRRAEIRREGGLPEDKPVIVTDARSNSLVIASNPEDYEAIAKLIEQLEQQRISPMSDIHQIVLHHNSAAKLRETVQKLFDERLKRSLGKGQEEQPADRVFLVEDAMTNTLLVVASKTNYDEIVKLVNELDVPLAVGGVIRTFYIKNQDVTKAADLVKKVFADGIYVGPTGSKELPESETKVTVVPDLRSSALIVSASPNNFSIIEKLVDEIDRVDTPIYQADTRFFQIKNADVVTVSDMLEQLFDGMSKTLPSDQQDQLKIKVIPDVRSNTLLLSGARYAMKRAEELIPKLDQPPETPTSKMVVYALKDASAPQLQPVLTDLFDKRAPKEQTGKRTPITVLSDAGSNSLIVTASQDDHETLKGLLVMLDKKSSIAQQMEIFPLKEGKSEQLAKTLTDLVEKQLTSKGGGDSKSAFAVTSEPRTNSLVVFAAPDLMSNVRSIVAKLDTTRMTAEATMRVFQLKNQKAEPLSELLDKFFKAAGTGEGKDVRQLIINFSHMDPGTGEQIMQTLVHQDITIEPDKQTNSLLVMAPKGSIDMMQMLVEMLDSVEPVTAKLQVFLLRNADAKEMKDLLDELFQTGSKGGGTASEERRQLIFAAGGEGGAAAGGPGGAGGEAGGQLDLAFSIDQRTNALIAAGSESYLKIVERLVYQLDYEEIEERVVRVVRLHNAKASEVADTMQQYFKAESALVEKSAKGEALQRQLQREVTVQDAVQKGEEGESSVLLLSYSPRVESQIVTMINELDQMPPQVMIQVLMAEVTLDDRLELGMEFALQDLNFSEHATTVNGIPQGGGFDKIGGTDLGATGETPLGGVSFTISGEDFNFLFRALQIEGRLEVLSRPSIMCQDGKKANITIGQRVPTVQDLTVSVGGVVTPSVTYEDVGIIVDVTPIINMDGYVNMLIEPQISSIATSSVSVSSGVTLPIFNKRAAKTAVTVKDSETIIIGGLITSTHNSKENKVPLAGDIPFLGNLFRATTGTTTKTELLIVLTPHVIRTTEDAHTISVEMRDQTGLIDNIRKSPLMGKLQATPESELGPIEPMLPTGEKKATGTDTPDEAGPELEEFGPDAATLEVGPDRGAIAVRNAE